MNRRSFVKTLPALAAWFHNCNRGALAKLLDLGPEKRLLFAQTVGYPS